MEQQVHTIPIDEETTIAYVETTVQCCPTQRTWTTDADTIGTWDHGGYADPTIALLGQCGGCGTLIAPTAWIIPRGEEYIWSEGTVEEPATIDLGYEQCDWCQVHQDILEVRDYCSEAVCEPCWDGGVEFLDPDEEIDWAKLPPV